MKSKWYTLLSVIMLFSLLAACGGGGTSGDTGKAPGSGEPKPRPETKGKLQFSSGTRWEARTGNTWMHSFSALMHPMRISKW